MYLIELKHCQVTSQNNIEMTEWKSRASNSNPQLIKKTMVLQVAYSIKINVHRRTRLKRSL